MGKIRTASKNFLCERCNTMIKKGESYYDWYNTNKEATWYHRRFHVKCLDTKVSGSDKADICTRVERLLKKEEYLIASNDGIKCYICGVKTNKDKTKYIVCETWEDRKVFYETVDNFKKYIDCYGNHF